METIRGSAACSVDASTLARHCAGHPHILIDLGTGDGRFVRHVAATWPGYYAIGLDLCGANFRDASRRAPANALYLVAGAHALPPELARLATHLTINFPWGSLLTGLLARDSGLLRGLATVVRPGARLEIRVNGGALAEAGATLDTGGAQIRQGLQHAGWVMDRPAMLGARELRACPTTWAHRLAFGRDPRALYLRGVWPHAPQVYGS